MVPYEGLSAILRFDAQGQIDVCQLRARATVVVGFMECTWGSQLRKVAAGRAFRKQSQ